MSNNDKTPKFKDFSSFLDYCKEEAKSTTLDDIRKDNSEGYRILQTRKNQLDGAIFQSDINEVKDFAENATRNFQRYLSNIFTGGNYHKGKVPKLLIYAKMHTEYLNLYNEALNKNINGSQEDNSILPKKKVKKEKRLEDYFQNITDFDSFINEIEDSFHNEDGKLLVGVIKLLINEDILIIQDRELNPFHKCWKESTTKLKIASSSYYSRILKDERNFDKKFLDPINSKLNPIISKHKISS